MSDPCIIACAITGSIPQKADNPAVPITVSEQIESTHEAFEEGASLVHIHVRDETGQMCSDTDKFARVQEGIRTHCPGMIIQFSTSGRSGKDEERGAMLSSRPDMASLATGSVNFPESIYQNPPSLIRYLAQEMILHEIKPEIEVFDLAMLYNAIDMARACQLTEPVHIQFVMGIPNALPAKRRILEFCVAELKRELPTATWCAAGISRHQLILNHWALEMGGHCRTGLEDNLRYDKTRLAKSNAELVRRVRSLCAEYDRTPATTSVAREILSLRAEP